MTSACAISAMIFHRHTDAPALAEMIKGETLAVALTVEADGEGDERLEADGEGLTVVVTRQG